MRVIAMIVALAAVLRAQRRRPIDSDSGRHTANSLRRSLNQTGAI
jgi:hypothetical protein